MWVTTFFKRSKCHLFVWIPWIFQPFARQYFPMFHLAFWHGPSLVTSLHMPQASCGKAHWHKVVKAHDGSWSLRVLVGKFICLLRKTTEIAYKSYVFKGLREENALRIQWNMDITNSKYNLDIGIPVTLYLTSFNKHISQFPWHIMFLTGYITL